MKGYGGQGVSTGHAVYTRVPFYPTPYWLRVHEAAMGGADGIEKLYSGATEAKFKVAARNLVNIGRQELEKEKALIKAAGLDIEDDDDIATFISRFNEVLMGVEQFKAATARIKEALKDDKQGKENRAPTASSWYTSKLATILSQKISGAINLTGLSDPHLAFSAISDRLESMIDEAIIEAWNAMLSISYEEDKKHYGSTEWAQVREASAQIAGFNEYFVSMIRSKIDFDKLKGFADEYDKLNAGRKVKTKLTNKKKTGVHSTLMSKGTLNLASEIKSRSIAGSVQEYVMSIMNSFGAAAQAAAASGGSSSSRVMTGETMLTDSVVLFNFNASIDVDRLTEGLTKALDDQMLGSKSLVDAARIMDDFYKNNLSKLDESFIVYQSTKSYSLSGSFRGFGSGGARKLSASEEFIAQSDPSMARKVGSYLNIAYNTGEGTVFANRRAEVKEQFESALMASAADMLFDDWTTIGTVQQGGAQAIHALSVEGINIPLSSLLLATGQAMEQSLKDMQQFIRVTVSLPSAAQTYASSFEEAWANWEKEAQRVKSQSTFNVTFLSNFKSIISQWLP